MSKLLFLAMCLFTNASFASTYNDLVELGNKAFSASNWKSYEATYIKLTSISPNNGQNWARLSTAYSKQGKHIESIDSLKKSIALGYKVGNMHFSIANQYLALDNLELAKEHLLLARKNKFRHADSKLMANKAWKMHIDKELFPILAADASKKDKWLADIEFLDTRMREAHFDLFANIKEEAWNAKISELKSLTGLANEMTLRARITELLASVNDGHTMLYGRFQGENLDNLMPIGIFQFSDGFYIHGSSKDYKHLIGAKILSIGDTPIEQVYDRLLHYVGSDNPMNLVWTVPNFMSFTPHLHFAGVISDLNDIKITYDLGQGPQSTIVKSKSIDWKLYEECCKRLTTTNSDAPIWVTNANKPFLYQRLDNQNIAYFRFNQVMRKDGITIEQQLQQILADIKSNAPKAFVLDIRQNNGGNGTLNPRIIRGLMRIEDQLPENRFFTLIGRGTFSAAMNLSSSLKTWTNTIFVGEPTGSSLNFTGENDTILLPNSGLTISVSSRRWLGSVSEDQSIWLAPDVEITLSANDYFNQKDPVMDYIKSLIR